MVKPPVCGPVTATLTDAHRKKRQSDTPPTAHLGLTTAPANLPRERKNTEHFRAGKTGRLSERLGHADTASVR